MCLTKHPAGKNLSKCYYGKQRLFGMVAALGRTTLTRHFPKEMGWPFGASPKRFAMFLRRGHDARVTIR